jgi:predicted metal-binding protein
MSDKSILDVTGKLYITDKTREWCRLPYPGHQNGCPNYGLKQGCPPSVPSILEIADLSKPFMLAIVTFDLQRHVQSMLTANPNWSDRQTRCCLYWQNGVRKELKEYSQYICFLNPGTVYDVCPEAKGVNVFRSILQAGGKIDTKPTSLVRKVSLIYYPK